MSTLPRPNDPQCHLVYDWEGQWAHWSARTCSFTKAREFAKWASQLYGLKPPKLQQHSSQELSYSQEGLISLQRDQVCPELTLHETAHYICDHMFDVGDAHHAPEWMAIYLWLLIKARIAPPIALRASARAAGIKWIPLWAVSPKRLAKSAGKRISQRKLREPAR